MLSQPASYVKQIMHFAADEKEADVLRSAVSQNGKARSLISASEYSLPDMPGKVNRTDRFHVYR